MAASRRYRSGFCNRALPDGRASDPAANTEDRWTFSQRIVIIAVMKLRLIVEKDPETGRYSSVFPELPGCASAGDTEDEAIANAKEALELWFELTE
jgi:predicted RNase H-like HicB family nuclease